VRKLPLKIKYNIVFQDQISEAGMKNWTCGKLQRITLLKRPKLVSFGKFSITFFWHVNIFSNILGFREEIPCYYMLEFQTWRWINFNATSSGRLANKLVFLRYDHFKIEYCFIG